MKINLKKLSFSSLVIQTLLITCSALFAGNIQASGTCQEILRSEISLSHRKAQSASPVSFREKSPLEIIKPLNYASHTLPYERRTRVNLKAAIKTRASILPLIIRDDLYNSNRIISEDFILLNS